MRKTTHIYSINASPAVRGGRELIVNAEARFLARREQAQRAKRKGRHEFWACGRCGHKEWRLDADEDVVRCAWCEVRAWNLTVKEV
jgi:hypothetical protein